MKVCSNLGKVCTLVTPRSPSPLDVPLAPSPCPVDQLGGVGWPGQTPRVVGLDALECVGELKVQVLHQSLPSALVGRIRVDLHLLPTTPQVLVQLLEQTKAGP